jgi:hypothetical protein
MIGAKVVLSDNGAGRVEVNLAISRRLEMLIQIAEIL